MGLESNKAIHQISVCAADKSKITCIGWTCNITGRQSKSAKTSSTRIWETVSDHGLDARPRECSIDLPRELTFLEVESSLPKLSPLPASGGSG